MKAAVQIPIFNYEPLRDKLIKIVQTAESAGFDAIAVMDHYFQIRNVGVPEEPMLEAYTTLGFIAGVTKKVKLGTLVTGVIYREPAFLLKQINTLDVLSNGRAFLGIGAAWNEEESNALGFKFPPLKQRFEMLEDVLNLAMQMWRDDTKPFNGKQYELPEPMNHPLPVSKPHPSILIGGGGEKKTLLLVAKYANACNLFPTPELEHKLEVLKQHCRDVGRNYKEIEKTVIAPVSMTQPTEEIIETCKGLAEKGIDKVFFSIRKEEDIDALEKFGKEIIPQIKDL